VDRIFIENLRVKCRVGTGDAERREPQDVIIDLSIYRSLDRAATTGDMGETINYRKVWEGVADYASTGEFKLVESLASGVASMVMDRFNADRVSVKARKGKYSAEPSIGVEIERARPTRGP